MYRLITLTYLQVILALSCLAVTLFHAFVYAPVSRKGLELDHRLAAARKILFEANLRHQSRLGFDAVTVHQVDLAVQHSVSELQQERQKIKQRVAYGDEVNFRIQQPFQLLDYDQRRLVVQADLQRLAAEKKVTLGTNAFAGLPEFDPAKNRSAVLWVQLAMAELVLATAINNQVGTLVSSQVLPPRRVSVGNDRSGREEEFFLLLEMTGPMENIQQFLRSLPLTSEEMPAAKLPPAPGVKPAFFINRFLLRSTGANPNEVNLEIIVSSLFLSKGIPS